MTARKPGPPLERMREAVAREVRARSLRQVAGEVGMSPSGLRKFLDGSTPYSATQRKLERWYVRESAQYGGGLGVGSVFAALRVLVHDLPPQRRERVLEEVLDLLQREYGEVQEPIPGWLEALPDLIRWEA